MAGGPEHRRRSQGRAQVLAQGQAVEARPDDPHVRGAREPAAWRGPWLHARRVAQSRGRALQRLGHVQGREHDRQTDTRVPALELPFLVSTCSDQRQPPPCVGRLQLALCDGDHRAHELARARPPRHVLASDDRRVRGEPLGQERPAGPVERVARRGVERAARLAPHRHRELARRDQSCGAEERKVRAEPPLAEVRWVVVRVRVPQRLPRQRSLRRSLAWRGLGEPRDKVQDRLVAEQREAKARVAEERRVAHECRLEQVGAEWLGRELHEQRRDVAAQNVDVAGLLLQRARHAEVQVERPVYCERDRTEPLQLPGHGLELLGQLACWPRCLDAQLVQLALQERHVRRSFSALLLALWLARGLAVTRSSVLAAMNDVASDGLARSVSEHVRLGENHPRGCTPLFSSSLAVFFQAIVAAGHDVLPVMVAEGLRRLCYNSQFFQRRQHAGMRRAKVLRSVEPLQSLADGPHELLLLVAPARARAGLCLLRTFLLKAGSLPDDAHAAHCRAPRGPSRTRGRQARARHRPGSARQWYATRAQAVALVRSV
mmetsp:Transcript_20833/g.66448  ORF Transcript_20833/g.66448 Transcript_20833/m.66448 type:complete len:546 (-) Transcript_20833:661-2298(-)